MLNICLRTTLPNFEVTNQTFVQFVEANCGSGWFYGALRQRGRKYMKL